MPKIKGKEYIEVVEIIDGQKVKVKRFVDIHGKVPEQTMYMKSGSKSRFVERFGKGGTFVKPKGVKG